MGYSFNTDKFYQRLDLVRERCGLTWKEVAADTGVCASTLTRLKQGRGIDIHNLAALAIWGTQPFSPRCDMPMRARPMSGALWTACPDIVPKSKQGRPAKPWRNEGFGKRRRDFKSLASTNFATPAAP